MSAPRVPDDTPNSAEALAECVTVFRKHLYLPNPGIIYATLGAIVANRMPGDPVWMLLVGSPSGGKTEALRAAHEEHDCRFMGTITEAGLLSGVSTKQRTKGTKGGLLFDIGTFGILLLKDFTTILSMSRDPRNALLAALREIADGSWARTVGSDGGRTITWEGKLGLVGGVTGAIDSAHGVMGLMGERFLLYRLENQSDPKQARRALSRRTPVATMRKELATAVADVLARTHIPDELPATTDDDERWLSHLAALVARMRSAVERDSYSREIVLIHEPEAPARLALALQHMLHAVQGIGLDEHAARELVRKIGFDSTPVIRRRVFTFVVASPGALLADLVATLGYPQTTTERTLWDLAAHDLVFRQKTDKAHKWHATILALDLWKACELPPNTIQNAEDISPDLSEANTGKSLSLSHNTPLTDKTGEMVSALETASS